MCDGWPKERVAGWRESKDSSVKHTLPLGNASMGIKKSEWVLECHINVCLLFTFIVVLINRKLRASSAVNHIEYFYMLIMMNYLCENIKNSESIFV